MKRVFLLSMLLSTATPAFGNGYARDGGTADWMCCGDKACTTIISQHADPVRAENACGKLTDADGKQRWTRSQAFKITPSAAPPPPPPPPPPSTGSTTLSWTPPTQNTDGSTLTDLAGYWISYGNAPGSLNVSIAVTNASVSSYVVEGLSAGAWYFSVRSYNSSGVDSAPSNIASKVIP